MIASRRQFVLNELPEQLFLLAESIGGLQSSEVHSYNKLRTMVCVIARSFHLKFQVFSRNSMYNFFFCKLKQYEQSYLKIQKSSHPLISVTFSFENFLMLCLIKKCLISQKFTFHLITNLGYFFLIGEINFFIIKLIKLFSSGFIILEVNKAIQGTVLSIKCQ